MELRPTIAHVSYGQRQGLASNLGREAGLPAARRLDKKLSTNHRKARYVFPGAYRGKFLSPVAAICLTAYGTTAAFAQLQSPPATHLPVNLSPWGMFMDADIVVKAVMVGLAFASLITWTIWLYKTLELFSAKRNAEKGLVEVVHSQSLVQLTRLVGKRGDIPALLVRAASEEMELSGPVVDHAGGEGVKERVSSRLSRIEARAGRKMTRGTGIIATIGATAPFVGLFGTVWGIMNAFIGISQSQTTNLAVVAPGIAEALLATAIGLVAAIPAVIIYNVFARSISAYKQLLGDVSAGVERLVSRDLDRRATPRHRIAAE
ncbi:MAG: tonB-system energizer ExbB [Rhizobiaceae bacterium]|nr:tonB-system energizer ExbB [Rhizobiaceae bacterium]